MELKLELNPADPEAPRLWFTSDLHFGHRNIIKHSLRPFASVDEMDARLIQNINACVRPQDILVQLGDFSMHGKREQLIRYLSQLNGTKYALLGNHDAGTLASDAGLQRQFFKGCYDLWQLKIKDVSAYQGWQRIVLCHYAMKRWNKSHYGAFQLYGHSHGNCDEPESMRNMDVGVDALARRIAWGWQWFQTQEQGIQWEKKIKADPSVLKPENYRPISYEEVRSVLTKRTVINNHDNEVME